MHEINERLSGKNKRLVEFCGTIKSQKKGKEKEMLSQNIKNLRSEKGMTQKELAECLHVTPQAVSRWETGEVEPSVSTIGEIAVIFGVTTDEIISGKKAEPKSEEVESVAEPTPIVIEAPKPVLALCTRCNKPLYESGDIVRRSPAAVSAGVTVVRRHGHGRRHTVVSESSNIPTLIYCKECAKILDAKIKDEEERRRRERKEAALKEAKRKREKGLKFGGLLAAVIIVLSVILSIKYTQSPIIPILISVVFAYAAFAFVSCLFLDNNVVGDIFLGVAEWGFVKFPGLIFSFDLDGIMWLIGMKILFAILGFLLGLAAVCLALLLSFIVAMVVFPFALSNNLNCKS